MSLFLCMVLENVLEHSHSFTCKSFPRTTYWKDYFVSIVYFCLLCCRFSSVQSLSPVWLFATPWIAARQASLSITNSPSLFKLISIELVMPSSHLILCRPLPLPASGSFPMSQLFASDGQNIGVSVSASVLPVNTKDWSPCCPRDSQESSPTPQFKSINSSALSFLHSPTLTFTHDYWKNHSFD